ncbi:MAG: hypothetical protein HZR80_17455 [Candidatus Heimdallarchaeota archaeon]
MIWLFLHDIAVAVGLLTAYNISNDIHWTLEVIKNEIIDQFTWIDLDQVVEYGLIEEYVRWVADGEETFVCDECQEKVHVVMECNHNGGICNGYCPHKNCTEIDKELLSRCD